MSESRIAGAICDDCTPCEFCGGHTFKYKKDGFPYLGCTKCGKKQADIDDPSWIHDDPPLDKFGRNVCMLRCCTG